MPTEIVDQIHVGPKRSITLKEVDWRWLDPQGHDGTTFSAFVGI